MKTYVGNTIMNNHSETSAMSEIEKNTFCFRSVMEKLENP